MASYAVPQGVDLEDKIIGSLTMKQLGILGLGGGICYLAYTKMDPFVWPFVVGIVGPFTLAFAFVRLYEMSFFQFALSFVGYYMKPEKRVWTGRADWIKLPKKEKKEATELEIEEIARREKAEKMTHLSQILETAKGAEGKFKEMPAFLSHKSKEDIKPVPKKESVIEQPETKSEMKPEVKKVVASNAISTGTVNAQPEIQVETQKDKTKVPYSKLKGMFSEDQKPEVKPIITKPSIQTPKPEIKPEIEKLQRSVLGIKTPQTEVKTASRITERREVTKIQPKIAVRKETPKTIEPTHQELNEGEEIHI